MSDATQPVRRATGPFSIRLRFEVTNSNGYLTYEQLDDVQSLVRKTLTPIPMLPPDITVTVHEFTYDADPSAEHH